MVINCNDIIKFNGSANSIAAIWCHDHGITGRVINLEVRYNDDNLAPIGLVIIDAGLGYNIWAKLEHVDVVAKYSEIPEACDV